MKYKYFLINNRKCKKFILIIIKINLKIVEKNKIYLKKNRKKSFFKIKNSFFINNNNKILI